MAIIQRLHIDNCTMIGCNRYFAHKPHCFSRHLNTLLSNVCIYYYCAFKSKLCINSTNEERPYDCSICDEEF